MRPALKVAPGTPVAKAIPAIALPPMSWAERLDVVDSWSQVIDGVYAHLPLKRALYGYDPIRALARLRLQVPSLSDLGFQRELFSVVNRLRDAHTQFEGPEALGGTVVALPFLVEQCGPEEAPEYVVSKVAREEVGDPRFVEGVTLEWWNGVPFDRAVDLHADRVTGGRPDARIARALESLTLRALRSGPPPDEQWVTIGYRDVQDSPRELRLDWKVYEPGRDAAAGTSRGARARRGVDDAAETIRRARKLLFRHAAEERGAAPADVGRPHPLDDFVTAQRVRSGGREVGHLRIWSFDVDDDVAFVNRIVELLDGLPQDGLIIDLRHNPGGLIWAAERLLQLFTPRPVVPTRFAMRTTRETVAMAAAAVNRGDLGPWAESLDAAARTGEAYSAHLPITSPEQCNDVGQRYGGPVVAVVDANTYSSGDLFAAGIVDNRIGPVVCVGAATGAGGANVWGFEDVRTALRAAGQPVPSLPPGVGLTVAIRRCVRGGETDGVLIEDAGVAGQRYALTRRDLFHRNEDLLDRCAELLAAAPRTSLKVKRSRATLEVASAGLDRVDVYADGHPAAPTLRVPVRGRASRRVRLPPGTREVEVTGFAAGTLRQRRRLP
jgi:hypothetical protein